MHEATDILAFTLNTQNNLIFLVSFLLGKKIMKYNDKLK